MYIEVTSPPSSEKQFYWAEVDHLASTLRKKNNFRLNFTSETLLVNRYCGMVYRKSSIFLQLKIAFHYVYYILKDKEKYCFTSYYFKMIRDKNSQFTYWIVSRCGINYQIMSNRIGIALSCTLSKSKALTNFKTRMITWARNQSVFNFFISLHCAQAASQQRERKLINKNCTQSSTDIINNVVIHRHKWWRGILNYFIGKVRGKIL